MMLSVALIALVLLALVAAVRLAVRQAALAAARRRLELKYERERATGRTVRRQPAHVVIRHAPESPVPRGVGSSRPVPDAVASPAIGTLPGLAPTIPAVVAMTGDPPTFRAVQIPASVLAPGRPQMPSAAGVRGEIVENDGALCLICGSPMTDCLGH